MKISLITPTFNSSKTIKDTIDSVIEQTENHPTLNIEYIIIDGASTDNTTSIIQDYQSKYPLLNIRLVSEHDKGIFDAMNKGVKKTTGDIVGIINSDDFYHNGDVLSKVIEVFESDENIDAVYGDLLYVDNDNIKKQTRYWNAGEYEEKNLNWGWSIPHPTFFVRRRVYERLIAQDDKIFDITLSLAADYELTFRLLKKYKIKAEYIPETFVTMRDGGASASSLKQRIKGWKEQRLVWKMNSLSIPHFFITRRLAHKIGQFLHFK